MEIRRGDLVIAVFPGDYGKPRPALVVQGDAFSETASVTMLPLTSALQEAPLLRVTVEPRAENGLERTSQIMVDKAATVTKTKIARCIGSVDGQTRRAVDRALLRFLALG
jgi:mRNA interferase MazF